METQKPAFATFVIYEVAHGGDVDASLEDLRRAGCTNVELLETDYSTETAVVQCSLPVGILLPSQLKLEFAVIQ
jgi:hypothetical protein